MHAYLAALAVIKGVNSASTVTQSEWYKSLDALKSIRAWDEIATGFLDNLQTGMTTIFVDDKSAVMQQDLVNCINTSPSLVHPAGRFFLAVVDARSAVSQVLTGIDERAQSKLMNFYKAWDNFQASSKSVNDKCQPSLFKTGTSPTIIESSNRATSELRDALFLLITDITVLSGLSEVKAKLPMHSKIDVIDIYAGQSKECDEYLGGEVQVNFQKGSPWNAIASGNVAGCRTKQGKMYLTLETSSCPGRVAVAKGHVRIIVSGRATSSRTNSHLEAFAMLFLVGVLGILFYVAYSGGCFNGRQVSRSSSSISAESFLRVAN